MYDPVSPEGGAACPPPPPPPHTHTLVILLFTVVYNVKEVNYSVHVVVVVVVFQRDSYMTVCSTDTIAAVGDVNKQLFTKTGYFKVKTNENPVIV